MIEVEGLTKYYGATTAINELNFTVPTGNILGFLGPNGAGKTTTMRILTGYLPADRGTAKIAGYEVHDQSMMVRQNIGYLPEHPPLYRDMTVRDFLIFVGEIKGINRSKINSRMDFVIDRCNLGEKRHVIIGKLSKGYQQRVGIAQALIHDPPVIVLDEPTVGLDPIQINEVRELIKSLAGDHTIILSTHILSEVTMVCNQVTIINQGKLVINSSPEELMREITTGISYLMEVEGDFTLVKETLMGIGDVQFVENISNQDLPIDRCSIRVRCSPETEPGKEIVQTLVNNEIGLYNMQRDRLSLEDIFLKITKSDITD